MIAFILRRLRPEPLVVMGVVAFISFMLFQYVWRTRWCFCSGKTRGPIRFAQLRRDLGLDQPFVRAVWPLFGQCSAR
jgi:ABC-type dipeptide/oligopeptide/nickel transport system permease component